MGKLKNKELILSILDNVSTFLDNLIEVHEVVFTQKIGQKLDYENLEAVTMQAREVLTAAVEITERKEDFRGLDELDTMLVKRYVKSLLDYATTLNMMIIRLHRKADGGKYGWFNYRKDLKEYYSSMDNYMSVAQLVATVYIKYKAVGDDSAHIGAVVIEPLGDSSDAVFKKIDEAFRYHESVVVYADSMYRPIVGHYRDRYKKDIYYIDKDSMDRKALEEWMLSSFDTDTAKG